MTPPNEASSVLDASIAGAWTVPGDGRMKTRNTTTGVRTSFNREGIHRAFAPVGTRLADIKGNPGPLYTSEVDGNDDRFVAQGYYDGPLSWSLNAKFVLAFRYGTNYTTMGDERVDVATGATYPLPFKLGANAVLRPGAQ